MKKFFHILKDAYIRNRVIIQDSFSTLIVIILVSFFVSTFGHIFLEVFHISETMDLIYEAIVEGV